MARCEHMSESMLNTKIELAKQEVFITIHTYHQCSVDVYYVVSPGMKGTEVHGHGCTDEEALEYEIEKRADFYRDQGYAVRTKRLTSTVK